MKEHGTAPDANYQIEFFAGYVTNIKDDAWKLGFGSEENYGNWIAAVMEKSWFESQVSPAETDRIITLSACSYEFDNARFVIHGTLKLVPQEYRLDALRQDYISMQNMMFGESPNFDDLMEV